MLEKMIRSWLVVLVIKLQKYNPLYRLNVVKMRKYINKQQKTAAPSKAAVIIGMFPSNTCLAMILGSNLDEV